MMAQFAYIEFGYHFNMSLDLPIALMGFGVKC
jgi:hypothetical protein